MTSLIVYLGFNGECEKALNFYKDCFAGEIISMQRFGESPVPSDDTTKDHIMHSEFRAGDLHFMASDSMPDKPVTTGSNVSLTIQLDDPKLQTEIFDKLSVGANVTMPLQDTFWGARFGMLTDQFGINWMLNCANE